MAELKTKVNEAGVTDFLNTVTDEKRRADCFAVCNLMEKITGEKAEMWGINIVGFGRYNYKYASGRTGEWFMCGFSPRKQNLTLYIMSGFVKYDELLQKLGKHKTGKSCLYINKIEDIDQSILSELITKSLDAIKTGKIFL
jgi:hypothetical protein